MTEKGVIKKKISKNFKKKVNEFLQNEDGKISKTEIIKTGAILITLTEVLSQDTFGGVIDTNTVTKSGTQSLSHSNHSSHSSHGSHGSHASF